MIPRHVFPAKNTTIGIFIAYQCSKVVLSAMKWDLTTFLSVPIISNTSARNQVISLHAR